MPTVTTTPTILVPKMGQKVSFNDPILIRWDWNPNEIPVTKFHLCIGIENGNWNLLNGEVGLFDRFSLVLPPLPDNINQIYIQLLYKTVVNEKHHAEEEAFVAGRITVQRA
jgi:hypothetical protein